MSLYFVCIYINVRVVKYDWHLPIVDCCIGCIVHARYNVLSGSYQFGPRNLDLRVTQVKL
jgi:hypothetical protein